MATDMELAVERLYGKLRDLEGAVSGRVQHRAEDWPREWFVSRLMLDLMHLTHERVGLMLSEGHGDIARHVLRERRADFEDANYNLYVSLEDMLDIGLAMWRGYESATPTKVLDALERFREAALLAAACLQAPKNAAGPVFLRRLPFDLMRTRRFREAEKDGWHQTTIEDLHALHYHELYTRMATRAVALHLNLVRQIDKDDEKETGVAARVKRYRKRKRRRVAAVVSLEIYEDDLELLGRFGYLMRPPQEMPSDDNEVARATDEQMFTNQEAIGAAVQAFLLQGFLTHIEEPAYPWAERIKRQRRRIGALTPRPDKDGTKREDESEEE